MGIALGALLLLLSPVAGCDDAPKPEAPPQAMPAPAPAPPAPAPPAATPPESPPAEAAPTPPPADPAPAEAKPPAAPVAAALPVADKTTRSERLLTHYRALHCLEETGASPDAVARAFVASGLSAADWTQALDELLAAMEEDANGPVAQAIRAAHERPCEGGADP